MHDYHALLLYSCLYICVVENFKQQLVLEAQYGTPSQYTPAINELIEYYKKVHV